MRGRLCFGSQRARLRGGLRAAVWACPFLSHWRIGRTCAPPRTGNAVSQADSADQGDFDTGKGDIRTFHRIGIRVQPLQRFQYLLPWRISDTSGVVTSPTALGLPITVPGRHSVSMRQAWRESLNKRGVRRVVFQQFEYDENALPAEVKAREQQAEIHNSSGTGHCCRCVGHPSVPQWC